MPSSTRRSRRPPNRRVRHLFRSLRSRSKASDGVAVARNFIGWQPEDVDYDLETADGLAQGATLATGVALALLGGARLAQPWLASSVALFGLAALGGWLLLEGEARSGRGRIAAWLVAVGVVAHRLSVAVGPALGLGRLQVVEGAAVDQRLDLARNLIAARSDAHE